VSLYDAPVTALGGGPADLHDHQGDALLVVNVASRCGLTPQYAGLQRLFSTYRSQGLVVLGFPCNQFLGQEPGSSEEIAELCSTTYGVEFPMFEKVEVNGDGRHPLFAELARVADAQDGHVGDVRWNFEKWVVAPGAASVTRFAPTVQPDDPSLVAAVEAVLPRAAAA
jgi:glutathione peroxidase